MAKLPVIEFKIEAQNLGIAIEDVSKALKQLKASTDKLSKTTFELKEIKHPIRHPLRAAWVELLNQLGRFLGVRWLIEKSTKGTQK